MKPYEQELESTLAHITDEQWKKMRGENKETPILKDFAEKPLKDAVIEAHVEKYPDMSVGEILDTIRNAHRKVLSEK